MNFSEMNFSRRARLPIQLFALAVLSIGLVFSAGPAQASSTGTVVAWGCVADGDYGQCNVPSELSGVTAIATNDFHSLALKGDGTVVAWGCGFDVGQCSVPSDLSGVTAIAAGSYHSLALRGDGTVVAWGCNGGNFGQCDVPSDLSGVTAIAAGTYQSLALKGNGTVVTWGCNGGNYGQCDVPSNLSGVIAIAAGNFSSLALKGNGTVAAWGCGDGADAGQCSVPSGLSGVTSISAGTFHSLALKGDGTIVAWGCGPDHGQCSVPSGLSGVTAIGAGFVHSLALNGDGTVAAWGCLFGGDYGQCSVPNGLSGVTAIAAGPLDSLALVGGPIQQVYYLHGSGPNPPTLTLDNTAPSAQNAKFKDSASIAFAGGNPWKEIGTWAAAPAGSAQTLSALSDLHAFLGLKNSDDQGTQFDLRAEVFRNGGFVGSSTTLCITGVTRNPDLAKEVTAAFGPFVAVPLAVGDVLSLKLSTRIGTNPNGSKCSGPGGSHGSALGLRIYFDALSRSARFKATFVQ